MTLPNLRQEEVNILEVYIVAGREYVHLALEHVCKAKYQIKLIRVSLKHVPGPQTWVEGSVD